ncbi:restriction endonuclease [Roseibium sediminicola]|uniref:Restriction endonuclease n=1 Tax=Roseibium sediminicola TaxID=2933272 RepID=A0ABT0GR88_9HYPH|nr:restriction endonuclease [Roseibium sp. CAU 1639]MCK7611942.1 restriction endonuclease [Roseibium sp. CAU 1639]
MVKIIPFQELSCSDLVIDAVYEGGTAGNASDDPISKLLPGTGNQGGFRAAGKRGKERFVVLYTSGLDADWPDIIDPSTGKFSYYGDNKTPGHELHETQRGGNRLLKQVFSDLHATVTERQNIPPFFVFQKYPTKQSSRSVQFKGLAAPGYPGLTANSDLIAIWRTTNGQRFQNYQAIFTILDCSTISRAWIDDLVAAIPGTTAGSVPSVWSQWACEGKTKPLLSPSTSNIRSVTDQTPSDKNGRAILTTVFDHFEKSPRLFEFFAARIFQMHDQRVLIDQITQQSSDGGRDAIGRYQLGLFDDPVYAEFALEAKCYRPAIGGHTPTTVGVKEVARLISRIRHREFGVLVTTSVIGKQAYEEVRSDQHPIIFFSGKDVVDTLVKQGFGDPSSVLEFLKREFPFNP